MPAAPPIHITWAGHATVLVEIDGFRLVTDPALTTGLAHLRRRTPVPEVAAVDVVAISHLHMDHLHVRSLGPLARGRRLIVPAGAEPVVARIGAASIEPVTAGMRLTLREATAAAPAIELDVVPANHLRGRGPHSRVRADPVGYIVRAGQRAVYFAGDTDLFDEMRDLGPLDVALLPIWGWGPTLGERHLDPSSATTATEWLDPVRVVPIHWGTYSPIRARRGSPPWLERPIGEFRAALTAAGLDDRLVVVEPGGSLVLDG